MSERPFERAALAMGLDPAAVDAALQTAPPLTLMSWDTAYTVTPSTRP